MKELDTFKYRTIKEIANLVFGFKVRRMVVSAEQMNSWVLITLDSGNKPGKQHNFPRKMKIKNF